MTKQDMFRERILDAARQCYIESPTSERMHALIAERAGVSRPTVYKYVGDQEAVRVAMMEREALSFLAALMPVFMERMPLRIHFRELVVAGVAFVEGNELFQAMLRENPALLARSLTVDLTPLLDMGGELAENMVRSMHPDLADTGLPLDLVIEWGVRMCVSIVTTPSPRFDLSDHDSLRDHLDSLFAIVTTYGDVDSAHSESIG
ncbi:TetR/AcrR family transcriptional regulator [Nocardia sp. NPDC051833]|uniref:TetR/AcrR family transcriptional regulator n=1 Tax=Nocardia sp. NPDC051833 TaxID=3155674 RepID=UPI003419BF9F